MSIADRVRAIVEPMLQAQGLEVYDVEHRGGQLRVTVERPDGGIDLDALSQATKLVSSALDEHDPIRSRYTLEVSSPGLERTLRLPTHFIWAVGQTVQIRTQPGVEGDRRVKGVIVAADDETVTVRVGEVVDAGDTDGPGDTDGHAAGAGEGDSSDGSDGRDERSGQPGERRLRYHEIERARTVFEWAAAVKPGRGSKPGRQKSQGRRSPSGSSRSKSQAADATSPRPPASHDERAREQ